MTTGLFVLSIPGMGGVLIENMKCKKGVGKRGKSLGVMLGSPIDLTRQVAV